MLARPLLVAFVALGCGGAPSANATASGGEEPGRGAALSMRDPSPEATAAAVDFTGSCAFARPPGDVAPYAGRIVIVADGATVFATAEFASGAENQIGFLRGGEKAAAEGPLAGGRDHGAGYAVILRDSQARLCRGYVRAESAKPAP